MTTPDIYSENWIAKTPPNPPTLQGHTHAVAKKARSLFTTPGNKRFLKDNTEFPFEKIQKAIEYAGHLHDAGKAHPEWQKWVNNTDNYKPNHSIRSSLFALEYLQNNTDLQKKYIVAITIAILHHHTNISNRNMDIEKKTINKEKLKKFTSQFQSIGVDVTIDNTTVDKLIGVQKTLRPPAEEHTDIRLLTTILRTYLIQADHIVSAKESNEIKNEPQQLEPTDFSLFETLRPFQTKVEENSHLSHIVGLAGCGEGKTHAAFQWGKKQIEDKKADGIVFALPTQTTTNNMYLNLTQNQETLNSPHIPPEKCELHHSANQIFYSTQTTKEDTTKEYETSAFLTERERKVYSAGMTVSTVDHILNTLINKQEISSIARGNLLNKAIIFDELHAYDETTLSNIIAAIQKLHEWNIPYFIITATLPDYIKEKIPAQNTIQSKGTLANTNNEREPYTVKKTNEELTPEILEKYTNDSDIKTVMVVKNTVREAQKFAFNLRNKENISFTYYSSEFTQKDRTKKENEVRKTFTPKQSKQDNLHILISTQVCEISLDISVDKIHTDIAPIDSLLQRMGRLHREGTHPNSIDCQCPQCKNKENTEYNCTIHFTEEQKKNGKIYPHASETDTPIYTLIKQTGAFFNEKKTYSFPKSTQWLSKIYNHIQTPNLQNFTYNNAVQEDLLYGPPRWDGEKNIDIRDITNRKQDVFPAKYKKQNTTPEKEWDNYHYTNTHTKDNCKLQYDNWTNCHSALYKFAEMYTVPMPRYWIHTDKATTTQMKLQLENTTINIKAIPKVNLNYSYKFGLIPSELETKLDNNFL